MTRGWVLLLGATLCGCNVSPAMTNLQVPSESEVDTLLGSGAHDLWVVPVDHVGASFLHFDGSGWKTVTPVDPPEMLASTSAACSAGPGAIWVGARGRGTNTPYLAKLTADGRLEDHTSELPTSAHATSWSLKLAEGEGTAVLAFLDTDLSTHTELLRFDGTRFVSLGTIPGLVAYLSVIGPDFIIARPGGSEGTLKRFDGTGWVDDPTFPVNGYVWGWKRSEGIWALSGLSSPPNTLEVFQFKDDHWVSRTTALPRSGQSAQYAPRGFVTTGPDKVSLVSVHAVSLGNSDVVAAPLSGETLGGDNLLLRQTDNCGVPLNCTAWVSWGGMFQLADGTVIVKSERATYAGSPRDMD